MFCTPNRKLLTICVKVANDCKQCKDGCHLKIYTNCIEVSALSGIWVKLIQFLVKCIYPLSFYLWFNNNPPSGKAVKRNYEINEVGTSFKNEPIKKAYKMFPLTEKF